MPRGVTVDDHGLTIDRVALDGVDFSRRKHKDWTVVESRFEGCRFEHLRVRDFSFGAGPVTSEYVDCVFDNSHIRALIPGNARFVRCSFRNARLTKWICNTIEFVDCVFTGAVLKQINFVTKVPGRIGDAIGRDRNRYEGNDFSAAELDGVAFIGVDLRKQRLPEGEDYLFVDNAEAVLSAALGSVAGWPDSAVRRVVHRGLDLYCDYARRGQQQLLLSRHSFARKGVDGRQAFARVREVVGAAQALGSALPEPSYRTSYPCVYFRAADPGAALAARDRERGPLDGGFDGVAADGMEPFFVLGSLLALIHDTRWSADLVPFNVLWPSVVDPSTESSVGIQELGASVRDALADVDDGRVSRLAATWAEQDDGPGSVPGLERTVADLVSLARRARDAGERLYCWTRSAW